MNRNNEDNAVSPVIATILIVLMTVVAAAAAAVVVMGMADTQPDYVVGLTVKAAPAGSDAVVTLYGSRDIPGLVRLEVIDAGSSSGAFVEAWNGAAGTAPVGVPLTAKEVARPAEEMPSYATNVWVKGTFADGTDQVLLMQAVTFTNAAPAGSDDGDEDAGPEYTLNNVKTWEEISKNFRNDGGELKQGLLIKFEDEKNYLYVVQQTGFSFKVHGKDCNSAQEFISNLWDSTGLVILDLSEEKISGAKKIANPPESNEGVGTLVKCNGKLYAQVRTDMWAQNNWAEIGTVT
ncbi:MAG TPA: type IV pilin [Methanocorpusculum sp.]|nr:type IV pilin [Methanocorpusculum sp.]HJK79796.1 type IV pilin [Methanocorpusculum sp.]